MTKEEKQIVVDAINRHFAKLQKESNEYFKCLNTGSRLEQEFANARESFEKGAYFTALQISTDLGIEIVRNRDGVWFLKEDIDGE